MDNILRLLFLSLVISFACKSESSKKENQVEGIETSPQSDTLRYEQESHLRNIRQLTFGGDNAEAYFSSDGQYLTMQRTHPEGGIACDQIFMGKLPSSAEEAFDMKLISTGTGRTTCSYFMPGDEQIIFASTHEADEECPPTPDRSMGYVWPIYSTFELYISDRNGKVQTKLTDNDFYDAEATLSPKGDKIVFTSTRNGDLDLYTMDVDGTNIQQVTDQPGYDGGAFFSPDGTQLIFRASRFDTDSSLQEYQSLLAQGLVRPGAMELYVCNVDGSDLTKITDLGNANWAPFFHPSGEKVIFSSNHASGGRTFNLYMVNLDGSGLEQITHDTQFDAFPMFSPDGTQLVFSSNRNNGGTRSTNVFIADWVE